MSQEEQAKVVPNWSPCTRAHLEKQAAGIPGRFKGELDIFGTLDHIPDGLLGPNDQSDIAYGEISRVVLHGLSSDRGQLLNHRVGVCSPKAKKENGRNAVWILGEQKFCLVLDENLKRSSNMNDFPGGIEIFYLQVAQKSIRVDENYFVTLRKGVDILASPSLVDSACPRYNGIVNFLYKGFVQDPLL